MPLHANIHGFIRFNGILRCVRCGSGPLTFTTCEPCPDPRVRHPVPSDVIEYTTRKAR